MKVHVPKARFIVFNSKYAKYEDSYIHAIISHEDNRVFLIYRFKPSYTSLVFPSILTADEIDDQILQIKITSALVYDSNLVSDQKFVNNMSIMLNLINRNSYARKDICEFIAMYSLFVINNARPDSNMFHIINTIYRRLLDIKRGNK